MKSFIVFSLMIATVQLNAQNFAPLGAKWTYTYADHLPFSFTYRPCEATVGAIEMFQGRMCSRLDFHPIPPWGAMPHIWTGDTIYLYENNDSVYFWSPYSQQFQLLYDFTADVGSSWVIGGLANSDENYPDSIVVTIDSTSTLLLNGDTLRVWHHGFSMYYDWGMDIIEGIGNNGFLIPSWGLFESRVGNLRCFDYPPQAWQFVPYPCDTVIFNLIGSTDESGREKMLTVSPNPFTNEISISATGRTGNGILSLFDPKGRLVYREEVSYPGTLELSHLPDGLYVCQFTEDGQTTVIGKIVKVW